MNHLGALFYFGLQMALAAWRNKLAEQPSATLDRNRGNMKSQDDIVFLFDCDNTLLDNDRVIDDLKHHIECEFGKDACDQYWQILEALRVDLGYLDYLGALQR